MKRNMHINITESLSYTAEINSTNQLYFNKSKMLLLLSYFNRVQLCAAP